MVSHLLKLFRRPQPPRGAPDSWLPDFQARLDGFTIPVITRQTAHIVLELLDTLGIQPYRIATAGQDVMVWVRRNSQYLLVECFPSGLCEVTEWPLNSESASD
jgi:hypothetical protein